VYTKSRVKTVFFPEGRSPCAPYGRTGQYYFQNGDAIYSDKISRFVIDCEAKTNGSVTTRLCQLYDDIFIDELQDLSGYDLDLLEVFLRSRLRVVMVGDPRQCTYVTNNAAKNSQYRGIGILKLIHQWQQAGLFQVETHARSFRCNQQICDYSDALWPDMDATVSHNTETTGHDGVFIVKQEDMDDYIERFSPTILRYNKNADSAGYPALNFGNAKGLEFERVLIIPHGPIKKYIQSGNQRWTPFFGPRNAEIKLGFQALS
jgi:DNA helicase-2/ATP-dependent DNA helicase PcrA